MTISPIGAVSTVVQTAATTPAASTSAVGGDGFGSLISKAIDGLTSTQGKAAQLSQLAATGDLPNISDLTIATSEAQLATSLTTAVRDKAVAAFNSIMSMPV